MQAQDVEVGCILCLPIESYNVDLKWKGGHGHPVVVIGKHGDLYSKDPEKIELSFVQMTHTPWQNDSSSGPSVHSPYGHYGRDKLTHCPQFPEHLRSRYWFRHTEYLKNGPGNFRLPHVFFLPLSKFVPMRLGMELEMGIDQQAKAYSSRLDEGSYLRLMQRLNLEPKHYVADGYWDSFGRPSTPPSDGSVVNTANSSEDTSSHPRGHQIARIEFTNWVLNPAPPGMRPRP
ncbi:hypothetical protein NHQ30_009909 [Ciborinia camelliae]|nr:hypothetical protein NHQ30_009909 [Ciborinia camelliae]